MSRVDVEAMEAQRIESAFDPYPGPSKAALTAELRQVREFCLGAIALLREGEEDTSETAIEMAEEGIGNVQFWFARRRELKGDGEQET